MDLDGDGHLDIISGSYWPGHIYLFRGRGDGTYAKGTELVDANGAKLHAGPPWESEDSPEMDSLAAAPHATDWDGDGDLDLLVGNIAGRVILIRNDGKPGEPKFTEKVALEAEGDPILVDGGDSGPAVGDWDGDGLADLLVGTGGGAVLFFRNQGNAKEPRYAKGVELVSPAKIDWGNLPLEGSTPERPGTRLKPCITDYNGDGLLDLLVGDFASQQRPEPELSDSQKSHRDQLRARRDELQERASALEEKLGAKAEESPEMTKLMEELSKIWEELTEYEAESVPHGWVWLYLRQAPARGN